LASDHCQRSQSLARGAGVVPEQTIARGFAGGGESQSARMSYAREMKEALVYAVQRLPKTRKCEKLITIFSDEDYEGIYLPHTDALMVTLAIVNHKIHQILVDNGSSADILYKSAFDLMKIDKGKLVGFTGE